MSGQDNKKTKYFSLTRAAFWALMIPISYFAGWIGSVTFVALCSLYANSASDFASYRADDDPAMVRVEQKLDQLIALLSEHK